MKRVYSAEDVRVHFMHDDSRTECGMTMSHCTSVPRTIAITCPTCTIIANNLKSYKPGLTKHHMFNDDPEFKHERAWVMFMVTLTPDEKSAYYDRASGKGGQNPAVVASMQTKLDKLNRAW